MTTENDANMFKYSEYMQSSEMQLMELIKKATQSKMFCVNIK